MDPKDFQNSSTGKLVRTLNTHWAFIPNELPPEISKWPTALMQALSKAERNLTQLGERSETLSNPHIFVRPFMHKEAMLSSQIEGKLSTMEGLYSYEAQGWAQVEEGHDIKEVHNYVIAMDYGLEKLDRLPLSKRLIRELHEILMEDVRGEDKRPGEFRDIQNFIGPPNSTIEDAIFIPPPVNEMHRLLDQLEKYIYQPSDLPALIRIALIHYQFEAIHPFRDGNGRIGRLLIVFQFCDWGLLPRPFLYISGYFERNYREYYDSLLAVSQVGDWERWIEFFLEAITHQSNDAVQRIFNLEALKERYDNLVGDGKIAEYLSQVIELFMGYPIMSIRQVEEKLGFTYTRAQRYVEKLEDLGIVQEVTGQTRDRLFLAKDILAEIERPLHG
ncbi:MAG: Fic family protein [Anaerolineales bacterium]|nr:MAG: Fic family protein [Anaerolineales bacterium]